MEFQMIRRSLTILFTLGVLSAGTLAWAGEDRSLRQAVASPERGADNVARDGARHPYDTLKFWGVKPRSTVIELTPGSGYWTDILAVYAKATKGKYIAGLTDLANPKVSEAGRKARANFEAKYADTAKFGTIGTVNFGAQSAPLGSPGSADMVITARNIHNWLWQPPMFDKVLADAFAALKPGGLLAIEEHRADLRAQIGDARDGYVGTDTVIAAATKAGFVLEARSEINANPKDTKDHPFGVWTLPPNRRTTAGNGSDPSFDRTKYDAIGESDRMTLRFRKPR
jgi:predicted methyltransferase